MKLNSTPERSQAHLQETAQGQTPPPMPMLFDRPRRSRGCGLWLLVLLLVIALGGVVSWQLMGAQEKERIRSRVMEVVRSTPLEFVRNWLLPHLDSTPPIPPINESGDGGVLPERTRREQETANTAPSIQEPIVPEAEAQVYPDGTLPGQEGSEQATDGSATAAPVVVEDERVKPVFVDDLAAFVVDRYLPGKQGGSLAISVQSLNQRYGSRMTGLSAPRSGAQGRASILRYAFTPSMVRGLYDIYVDAFLRSIARTAQSKSLTDEQTKSLYQTLGSRCTLLAGGLESVAGIADLTGRLHVLDEREEAVSQASRRLLDARFELEQARDNGQSLAQYQAAVNAASNGLQEATNRFRTAEQRLAEDIRRGGAGALNKETVLYLARWVGRRLEDNAQALESVQASAQVLRDLASRCVRAAREGAPAQPASAPLPNVSSGQAGSMLPPSTGVGPKVTDRPGLEQPVQAAPGR